MENVDLAVLDTAIDWIQSDGQVVLVTVAKTWGSSPRPAGSMMVLSTDGRFEGSLSGGCIEEEVIEMFGAEPPLIPVALEYGITKDQAVARGLPCGGEVTVVGEVIRDAAGLLEVRERIERRERVQRDLALDSGQSSLSVPERLAKTDLNEDRLQTVFEPKWRMLVIGAGQLSSYVTQMALLLGYDVAVCDPRENYRSSWMHDAADIVSIMPDDFILDSTVDEQTAVLALTHDPKLDDLAIMEALNSKAFYVGALGSSRTNGARRERLRDHFDITEKQLEFLSGPIGIDLNTRTASEIALAIMTEITARRNGIAISSSRI